MSFVCSALSDRQLVRVLGLWERAGCIQVSRLKATLAISPSRCPGPHCGIQIFVSVSGSRHPCLTVVFCFLFVQVNPRRVASGFCGLKLWTWSLYHHQRVAVNGHICSQVVDIVVMDLVQKTAMCAVLRDQGLEVQSIRFTSSVAAFVVLASVEVISFPIWNPIAFQSIVLGFSVFVPPFPSRSSHDSPRKGGWQPQLPFLLVPCFRGCDVPFPTQFFPKSDP